ncbi:MAG: GNAT family N-acetyltransferase [Burkholderiales bacterium]|nr:GNAT family N-acetyltransferase [Burkholderiales bacterium]MDE2397264.1 GNAT family N-acetyltransferase [Burkholderiales bacterium]MDE2457021.1 GNAT family N-acetyltransferase [Burkholderiales bacterium]
MARRIRIAPAESPAAIETARSLMREYAASLGVDLCFQAFEAELAGLPGAYAAPAGALLLAEVDGEIAGCGAMRPWGEGGSEMKRVYVRPALRGLGLGRALAQALIERAQAAGHGFMLLDTLPQLETARQLYLSLGFRPVPRYNDNPIPGVHFLRADFHEGATRR